MVNEFYGDKARYHTYYFSIRGHLLTMMGHLPAEIWSHIADYLPPSALDAMNSTCSSLRRISIPSAAVKRIKGGIWQLYDGSYQKGVTD